MSTRSIPIKHHQQSRKHNNRTHTPPEQAAAIPGQGHSPLRSALPWLALLLLAFLAYLPALRAGFIWDDDALTDNMLVRSVRGLGAIWTQPLLMPKETHYWPLVYSSFWLEHLLFGLRPAFYHLDNILLHGLVTLLLWRLLRGLSIAGAWLAAALFAVHPVHVESVAWIIERKDVLSGTLYLGAALAYLRFQEATPARRWRWYGLSIALFAGALLSKSIVVTLPLALGIALWWRQGRRPAWRDLAPLAPLLLLGLVITLGDLSLLAHRLKPDAGSGISLLGRIQLAGGAFWFYLGKLAWPYPLVTLYPKWTPNPGSLLAWAPLLAGIGLLAGLWFARKRIGYGPLAAMAFFSVTIAPALGLIHFSFLCYARVADRFQYLASIGPLVLVATGLVRLTDRMRLSVGLARAGAALLLALLGGLCLRQTTLYHDSLTLFRANLKFDPENWGANCQYGCSLLEIGRNEEAAGHFAKALRLAPSPDESINHYLAQALTRLQQYEQAEIHYKEALRLNPQDFSVFLNYGACLASQGRLKEAVAAYQESLRLRPNFPDTLNNLGNALMTMGRLDEAAQNLEQAVRLDPNRVECRINLGAALCAQNKLQEAQAELAQALRIAPGFAVAHDNMGIVLLKMGRLQEAAQSFQQAAKLEPQTASLHFHLGEAYECLHNTAEAVRCYQEALRLAPNQAEIVRRLSALGAQPPAAPEQ